MEKLNDGSSKLSDGYNKIEKWNSETSKRSQVITTRFLSFWEKTPKGRVC